MKIGVEHIVRTPNLFTSNADMVPQRSRGEVKILVFHFSSVSARKNRGCIHLTEDSGVPSMKNHTDR